MYYITVSNGLLQDGHRQRMGAAVWEFMWLLDKITEIDKDGNGWVLGGKSIKLSEIANSLQIHRVNVSRNLKLLEKETYITTKRTRYGIVISVKKAKKIFKSSKPRVSENANSQNPELAKTHPRVSDIANNIIDNTTDKTYNTPIGVCDSEESLKSKVNPLAELVTYYNQLLKSYRNIELKVITWGQLGKQFKELHKYYAIEDIKQELLWYVKSEDCTRLNPAITTALSPKIFSKWIDQKQNNKVKAYFFNKDGQLVSN